MWAEHSSPNEVSEWTGAELATLLDALDARVSAASSLPPGH